MFTLRTGRRAPLLLGLAGLAAAVPAAAQDERWTPHFGPNVAVSFGATPSASVGDSGEQYGRRQAGFSLSVPIKGGWDWDGTDISGFRLLVHGGVRADSAAVPFRSARRGLYAVEAGMSGVHVLGRDRQILWSAGTSFAEDNDTVSSPKPRLTGRVMVLDRRSDRLTLVYGGAYTFILGRGRLLPIFGVVWRPRPGTTVNVIGPISGRLHHRVNTRLFVGAQAGLRGNQYRMSNTTQFSSPGNELHLRVRELRLGGEVGTVLSRSLALLCEAGVATARRLTFADGSTELFASSAGTAPYASVGLRLSFSTRPRWEDWDR